MKQKKLLNLGMMLAAGLGAQAQTVVFHEGFDAAQTKAPTDPAYYEFINSISNDQGEDERGIDNENAAEGAGCMHFYNVGVGTDAAGESDAAQHNHWWMRAVKFRNLPLEEGKSYRLSYRFKGTNTWNDGANENKCKMSVALMQGGENCDIPLLDAKGNEFKYEDSYFNPNDYERYSHMFYFASNELQKKTYAEKNPDREPLQDKYFATFNIYNPGDFWLDEVELVESSVKAVQFENEVLRVQFGYETNAKDLVANSSIGVVLMPASCVKVTVNGTEVKAESVELHKDGNMYIYLDEDAAISDADAKVEVAFTNPSDPQYQLQYKGGNLSPEGVVADFEGEAGSYLADLSAEMSYEYTDPFMVSSTPSDGSFALDEKTDQISFTFDKKVLTVDESGNPVVCTVNGEELELLTKPEYDENNEEIGTQTLTFGLKDGKTFTKGLYTATVNQVVSTKYIANSKPVTATFETGKVKIAETIYTLLEDDKTVTASEGGIPDGWTVMVGDNEHQGGSGSRAFLYTNSNVQSALYMRDWEGKAVATKKVTIPAGEVELRAYTAGWGNTGSFQISLLNAAGEKVIDQTLTVSQRLEKNKQGNFQADAFRFTSDGGEYTYSVELANGSNELLNAGFEIYKYEVTEGEKDESEVIAEGNFAVAGDNYAPQHGTGWKIYRDNGNMRDPGANCSWGGDDWTGGGGPRVKTMGNKGMNGAGIYLANNAYATYGEYLLQTDHGGTVAGDLPEKTLDLKAAKYQFTYYVVGWKDTNPTLKLEVFNQADGITGSPIYTREDGVTGQNNSGNDSGVNADKVQFFWTAPADGKYILKFTASNKNGGTGEICLGNVTVETTASLAVTYANLMKANLKPAQEELDAAKADEKYKGDTRDALEKAISDYTDPDFHTPEEYTTAFAVLEKLTKQSATRRANIDKFPTALADVEKGLNDAQGTKYEALPQYPIVVKAYNDYKDVDCVALSDEELQEAVTVMGDNGALLSNMVSKCVPLITQQIVDLAAAIVSLDPDASGNNSVIAAGNAITDDQALAASLKTLYTAKLYRAIANGDNPFKIYDAALDEEVDNPIDASFLMQNSKFYTTAVVPAGKENVTAEVTDFPGWTISVLNGAINPIFTTAWGGTAGKDWAVATCPIANCAVKTGWGNQEYDVSQLIQGMPVANYTVSIKIGEDGAAPHECYAYLGEGDAQVKQVYEGTTADDGTVTVSRDNNTEANNKVFENVVPVVADNVGSMFLGAHMIVNGGFGNVDDAVITMTSAAKDFDYTTAAKDLEEKAETAVKNVQGAPEGEPTSVSYYNLDGTATSNPSGIVIKVVTYANGYIQVQKAIVK